MNHQRIFRFLSLTLLFICLSAMVAWAGPHLKSIKLGKSLFNSSWTHVIILSLLALSLPFILYGHLRQYFKAQRTLRALRKIAAYDPNFDWKTLKARFSDIFMLMNQTWDKDSLTEVSNSCTPSYWQNHHQLNLDRWKEEGYKNISQLNKINRMDPILVRHSGSPLGDDSIVTVYCKANVENYLVQEASGHIAEGQQGFKDVENIWTFQLNGGTWRLNNVEEIEFRQVYIDLTNEVPIALRTQTA